MGTLEEIRYLFTVNTSDAEKGIDRVEKKVNKVSEEVQQAANGKMKQGFEAISRAAVKGMQAAGAATATLAGAAVKGFADYQQLTGGVETLFKSSSNTVMKYAENAYKTAGLSANQYMETVTSFSASLLQGLGGDTEKAAKYADMAVTDMADNANKMGTSMSMIQDAYQGFAKDNYTMLDNLKLGYGGTAGEMARLINDSGVMGDSFKATAKNVSDIPFDKLIEGINVTQKRMGITGTTAKEASETISGSFNSAKSAFSDFITALGGGGDANKAFDNLLEASKTFLDNLVPAIQTAIGKIAEAAAKAVDKFEESVPGGEFFTTLAVGIGAVVLAITTWTTAVRAFNIVQTIFNTLMAANPVYAITLAIIGVTAALTYFLAQTELGKAIFRSFLIVVEGIFIGIQDAGRKTGEAIGWAFSSAVNAIKGAFGGIGGFFKGVWNTVVGIFRGVGTAVGNAIGGSVRGVVNAILGFAESTINGFIRAINAAIGMINKIPGVNIGRLGMLHIPRMYTGGIVEPGGRIIHAGDGGEDEWVIPESKMANMLEKLGGAGSAVGQNITINVSGVFATDPSEQRKVAEQIVEQINLINKSRLVGSTI